MFRSHGITITLAFRTYQRKYSYCTVFSNPIWILLLIFSSFIVQQGMPNFKTGFEVVCWNICLKYVDHSLESFFFFFLFGWNSIKEWPCKLQTPLKPASTESHLSLCYHNHHHVPEGLGMLSCSLILKMKLVPPSLPRSSYVSSSFWFIL